jgi:hypothetical protein
MGVINAVRQVVIFDVENHATFSNFIFWPASG